ncbi:hypothetical protein EDC61_101266 [Sulfuritortus calidifontis]|uniref:Uncharacterized protein n=1 Tax=Sulfuritortus calidifontis TaxID=1914471 RepID=A0A4R3K0W7_9PROT|nr:hypothetical protein [Sulfuritortus calidifontis]TCS74042.1 hypothetical protein EDC61_101266 [Sulfuritortus calidifontis]
MTKDESDLYGEIDALYGKLDQMLVRRAPDALAEHDLGDLDFPRLTEVVEAGRPLPTSRPAADAPRFPPRVRQALSGPVPAKAADPAPLHEPSPELMAAIESRLFDLLARHQQEVDAAVRRIVQEELAKRPGK